MWPAVLCAKSLRRSGEKALEVTTVLAVRTVGVHSVSCAGLSFAVLAPRAASSLEAFIPKTIVCLREGYGRKFLLNDLLAGLTVGVIALPLAIAFAIASHVRPERGLYTAIIAGFLISLLGGSANLRTSGVYARPHRE